MKLAKSKLSRRTTKTRRILGKATKATKEIKATKKINITTRIIPSIKDFKKTTYYENLLYNDDGKPINIKTITSDMLRKYILEMNTNEYIRMIKEIAEIKTYARMKGKFNFQPVSIEWIRANLWDARNKVWKPLNYYWSNGDNPNNPARGPIMVLNVLDRNKYDKVFSYEIIFDGDLIEYDYPTTRMPVFSDLKNKKIHKDWLQSNKPGPYKYENYDYENEKKYFYLSGMAKFGKNDEPMQVQVQVCKCNRVSDTCVGGLSWIPYQQD